MPAAYRFERFAYEPAQRRLTDPRGEAIPLQPKVLDGLELFLERAGELVTREQLCEALWPGVFVTDNSVDQLVRKLRKALGDAPRAPRLLETVPRQGYRFIAAVDEVEPAETAPPQTNLPRADPGFIGRTVALAELERMLASERLITVLGSGGVGKTRLVRHAVGRLAWSDAAPSGGVWFCDLTSARDRRAVLTALRASLRLEGTSASLDASVDELVCALTEPTVVVLDNAEQVAADVATLGTTLVEGAPSLTLVVTSRERLHVGAERCLEVVPLAQDDAVTLLRDRAEAVRVGLGQTLLQETAARIVERLEGSPLAIGLAAARLALLTPEQLLERLSSRVLGLTGRARDLPDRQRSLQACVAWSWELLDPRSQQVAARCAVFRGGFTVDAAASVIEPCDDTLDDALLALRDASLLRSLPDPGSPRFALHEPVREYAEAQLVALGAAAEAGDRHLAWAASLAHAPRPLQPVLAAEHENLWAGWGHPGDDAQRLEVALLLARANDQGGVDGPVVEVLDEAVQLARTVGSLDRVLYARATFLATFSRDPERALEDADALWDLTRADGPGARARAALVLGKAAFARDEHELALRHLREAWALCEEASAPAEEAAHILLFLGFVLRVLRQADEAEEVLRAALRRVRQTGDPWREAQVLMQLGSTYEDLGRLADQERVMRKSLQRMHELRDAAAASRCERSLATIAGRIGRLDEAEHAARAALSRRQRPMDRFLWEDLLAGVLVSRGALVEAEEVLVEAEATCLGLGRVMDALRADTRLVRGVVAALGGARERAAVFAHEALSIVPPDNHTTEVEDVPALAALLVALGGDPDEARGMVAEAQDDTVSQRGFRHLARAILAERAGDQDQAAELVARFDALDASTHPRMRWARRIVAAPSLAPDLRAGSTPSPT